MCAQTLVSNPTPVVTASGPWETGSFGEIQSCSPRALAALNRCICLSGKRANLQLWPKAAWGLTPAENSRAPLCRGHVSQDRMAALPYTSPCAGFRAQGNHHHLSSSGDPTRWLCSTPSLTPPQEQSDLRCPTPCQAVATCPPGIVYASTVGER